MQKQLAIGRGVKILDQKKREGGGVQRTPSASLRVNPRTSKGGGRGQMDPHIGFSDLKFEAFKQSK